MRNIVHIRYLFPFVMAFFLVACSTQKNTFITRNYHNLTAHYNVYFNGNEAMKAGLEKIKTQVEEDYTKILPVYKESLPKTETLVSSDMNTAIDKGTKLIKFHSITKAPENYKKGNRRNQKRTSLKPEYNQWVDDAYIMIGRGYFYRKEFIQAASIFQLIIRKYKEEPVKYEAFLWLARCYSESERYTEAGEIIQSMEGDKLFPEKLAGELAIVAADLHIKQHQYDEAIHYLNIGIKKIKGNQRKTRYTYILAQLYQETGKQEQALEAYHRVIRRGPDYKMLFSARINSAGVFSGQGDAAMMKKELNKMRRKRWNAPFLDQIYFALGNIAYNEGKTDEAIEMYRKSVSSSYDNTFQRVLSSITLAEIYFEKRDYIPSALYYDSAMVLIDENYPNYEAISKKYTNLNGLSQNLLQVSTEDSLQALARLSEDELNKKIDGWIQAEKDKQQKMMESGVEGDGTMNYYRATDSRMRLGGETTSSWYFYNTTTVSYGKKEFAQMWGERKEEDDWRRSNKSEIMFDESGEPVEEDLLALTEEKAVELEDDPTTRNYYLQNIPLTDSMLAASHLKIRDALFNAGTTLKNEFSDFEKAIECFSELNIRYPENIYRLSSWFYLWDSYKTITKTDSAGYYRGQIISYYPESNYAKYLINPNYFIEEESRKDSLNRLYNQAFIAYKNRDFPEAARLSHMALDLKPDTTLLPKVQFIRTVSESRSLAVSQFGDSLRTYINRFPASEPTLLAKQVLNLIGEDKLSDYNQLVSSGYLNEEIANRELMAQQGNADDPYAGKWDPDPDLLHYFIIAFPSDNDINVNRLKFDIANYNLDHYTMLDFDIETENLNNDTRLVIVRNFDNKESALVYFLSIIRNPEVFKTLAGKEYYNFVASNNNYREILSDRSYATYTSYFARNYSKLTSGRFSETELASPEELMARLKEDPNEQIQERGEYVVVAAPPSTGTGQPATPAIKLFTEGYDVPHSFLIVIDQENFGTGYLQRDFSRYHLSGYREKRFRVIPGRIRGKTLLSVSGFPNAWEASEYMKKASTNTELFKNLGNTPYERYIVSDPNLAKLIETDELNEWKRFYQANYVYRKPTKPKTENEAVPEKEVVSSSSTLTEIIPASSSVAVEKENAQTEKSSIKPEPGEEQKQESEAIRDDIPVAEIYEYKPEAPHSLIYILPAEGSNQTLLITYLTRFNAIGYRSAGLEIKTLPFDTYRSVVRISGMGDLGKAREYSANCEKDSRITLSLRNVEYRSFLISDDNLTILLESKDIQGYLRFYTSTY